MTCARASSWVQTVSQHTAFSFDPPVEVKENSPRNLFKNTIIPDHGQEHFSESRIVVALQAVSLGAKQEQEATFC